MHTHRILYITVLLMAAGLLFSWSELVKLKKENIATEKKAQRACDYMEIQNVIAKHTYYHAAQKQWEGLDAVWSKRRDDISYGHNDGIFIGRESVENYYGKMNENRRRKSLEMISKLYPEIEDVEDNEGVGDLVIHTLTTPDIEIAEDGQTAQGIWASIGLSSRVQSDGNPQYNLPWEKFGVDFIKEDGEWKIWHFQVYTEKVFFLDDNMERAAGVSGGRPLGSGESDGQEGKTQGKGDLGFDINVEMYQEYSPTKVPTLAPRLPQPYEKWKDATPYIIK